MNEMKVKLMTKIMLKGAEIREKMGDKLKEDSGNWIEESVKYIVGAVIGLIVLGGLTLLFKDTVIPELVKFIKNIFTKV